MRSCHRSLGLWMAVGITVVATHAKASLVGQFTDVVGYSGDVVMISAPPRVRNGWTESNRAAKLFVEQKNYVVTHPLPVDTLGMPGRYDSVSDFKGGDVPSGMLNSYFLHVDSRPLPLLGWHWWPRRYRGSVTFENPILGLIGFADTLLDTRELQADATRYPLRRHQNHDLDPILGSLIGDTVWISNDRRTLSFDFLNASRMDQLRIVTAVPEPTAFTLLAIAGLAFVALKRRLAAGIG